VLCDRHSTTESHSNLTVLLMDLRHNVHIAYLTMDATATKSPSLNF
jgi:hypothetical protein